MDGQAVAYCEMVSRGVRVAGQIDLDVQQATRLQGVVEREGCKSLVRQRDPERVAFWIYRDDAVIGLIDALETNPMPTAWSIWSMGKLFGYGDVEVLDFLRRLPR